MSTPAGSSRRMSESTVLACRIEDVDQALVRLHLEVLAAVLVDVRRADDAVQAALRRQRDRPDTRAPVRCAVSTIFFVDWSTISWSYALSRIRIFCWFANLVHPPWGSGQGPWWIPFILIFTAPAPAAAAPPGCRGESPPPPSRLGGDQGPPPPPRPRAGPPPAPRGRGGGPRGAGGGKENEDRRPRRKGAPPPPPPASP